MSKAYFEKMYECFAMPFVAYDLASDSFQIYILNLGEKIDIFCTAHFTINPSFCRKFAEIIGVFAKSKCPYLDRREMLIVFENNFAEND
jgi:hypothetical protein